MNVAVDRSALEGATVFAGPVRTTRVTLGMPELCLGGVSETWLLKTCGDLHWRLIAEFCGVAAADFRDVTGEKIYAAFCAMQSEALALDAFVEHDELTIRSEITRVSRTRFASTHWLQRRGAPAGKVALLSTFVKRAEGDGNRSIAKVGLPGLPAFGSFQPAPAIAGLPALLRPGRWTAHLGFKRGEGLDASRFDIRPCPSQDFNGAELLYFSAYQGFADRAEWELTDLPARGVAVREREIVFHGNLEPGEGLVVRLRGTMPVLGEIRHWMSLEAAADGRPLADIFTTKAISSRGR
ncbi:Pnap_2097 family protein [Methylopila sp. 73B]|uniref:Pnap_2097 family protein n=1 Tax=Methylopila sp. 73B TaxID=1120792 RepID=UPI00036D521B|nr:Pnap_2097 family protein [Methylopila sp. 73B]